MKWKQGMPEAGDIVRVPVSGVYHYGIYVSDEEVIQFGLPPRKREGVPAGDICVLKTDVDTFRCGQFPEVGVLSPLERIRARSRAETVLAARARLGEKGYDILNNNCEHFVYECRLNRHYSGQAEKYTEGSHK